MSEMKCSICQLQGHRSNNKMFHPKSVSAESAESVELIPLTPELIAILGENFAKCVKGYHLVNQDPIKESPWEDINVIVMEASGCAVKSQASGSHKSGADLSCSLGDFSNKSSQYAASSFGISSYRLSSVCSNKAPGQIEDIISEINRRKNFNYYSIIVRAELGGQFHYDWYLIPSDLPELNPESYTWRPSLGKTAKHKGEVTGWETDELNGSSMSITFSMSSQLWINLHITEQMKQYIVGSCRADIGRKYNYIDLFERG